MAKKTTILFSKPITHSDILWHFTGGAPWNSKLQRQSQKLKNMSKAFEAFCSILSEKNLRVGGYHEIIERIIPKKEVYNRKTSKSNVTKNYCEKVNTVPVCCVADIPREGLSYHSKRYGKFGIGFRRNSLIKAGFNPVFYTLSNQKIISHFYDAQHALESSGDVVGAVDDLQDQIENIKDQISKNESNDYDNDHYIDTDVDIDSAKGEAESLESSVAEASNELAKAMAFIKTFSMDEFDTIYAEREWRSVKPFKFGWKDIEALLLPKEKKYYERFQKDWRSKLDIPARVKILSWDDLSQDENNLI